MQLKKIKINQRLKAQLSNLSVYLLATVISSGVGVLINPLLAANLEPSDYAIIGYYISLNTLFLPLISFSLASFYTRKFFGVTTEKLKLIKNTIITFQLIAGTLSILIIIIIFNIYAKHIKLSLNVFPYLYFTILTTFLSSFFSFMLTEKRLLGEAKRFFRFNMINMIIGVFSSILLVVVWKLGATGRLAALLITSLVSGFLALKEMNIKFQINLSIIKEALAFSWPIFFSAILYFLFGGFDRILLERLDDTENLGFYNVAYQITAYVAIFGTAILQTFDPDIYKATSKQNIAKAMKIVFLIVGLVFAVSLIFYLLASPIINILTYGRYLDAVPYSKILVFRNVASALAFSSSGVIIGLGYPKVELVNRIVGSIGAYFIYLFLINKYQFTGAAWGQTITLLIMSMVSLLFILWKYINQQNKL
ncbi:oligosaccharide flippase family protein [Maribacter dokdonensis]|uniref:oligosaccharide flippase family protein n=1 Tax=Maribacter dokdonensis TaxID=320912 RepID=UPI002AB15F60|nr:oligosaccharide flippase family protein [Maribacter dokdonensis]